MTNNALCRYPVTEQETGLERKVLMQELLAMDFSKLGRPLDSRQKRRVCGSEDGTGRKPGVSILLLRLLA